MPNIKSAVKRVRTSEANRRRNASNKSLLNTVRRKYLESLTAGDKPQAQVAYSLFCSTLDKSAKKGVISKSAASRRKARAHAKLSALA